MVGDPEQHRRDPGNAALSSWFPRPVREGPRAVLLSPEGSWTVESVHDLLAEGGTEWRDKVGVAGPRDGSAKPETRLLAVRGHVVKTRLDQPHSTAAEALAALERVRDRGGSRLWHPAKLWFALPAAGAWYGASITPELVTLRALSARAERFAAWTAMLADGLAYHARTRRGLDLNPANFGRAPGELRLHYLDDEVYETLDAASLAGAIAARIPEEPDAGLDELGQWGFALAELFAAAPEFPPETIADEIDRYPLAERFAPARVAVAAELRRRAYARSRRVRGASDRVCVIADVHGNAVALDAVLADARARGADSFLFLGDAVGYGPDPRGCVQRLAELPRATCIRGNHDHAVATGHFELGMNDVARRTAAWTTAQLDAAERAWLGSLPVEAGGDGWLAVHGAPKDPRRFLAYVYELTYEDNLRHLRASATPLCFYGHTHVQIVHVEGPAGTAKLPGPRAFTPDRRWSALVNPGSVGQPRDADPRAAYALWDRGTSEIVTLRVPYDVARTVAALRAADLPSPLAARLQAGA